MASQGMVNYGGYGMPPPGMGGKGGKGGAPMGGYGPGPWGMPPMGWQHHHHHHHHHNQFQGPPQGQGQQQQQQQHIYQQRGAPRGPPSAQSRVDGLKNKYESILAAPPPFPATVTKPVPMKLRPGREVSCEITVKLPLGEPINVKLASDDTIRDVKAAIEDASSYFGAELRLFKDDFELKDNTLLATDAGISEGTFLYTKEYHARAGWGVATLDEAPQPTSSPPPGPPGTRTYKKEELAEWSSLKPGESKVLQGYEEKPMSARGKVLMDIYETVMARPPPGTYHDPRAEVPCTFWASGKFCRNAEKCPFSHAGKRGQGGFFFQRPDPRSRVTCTFFVRNRCLRGPACPFKHSKDGPKRPMSGNPDLPPQAAPQQQPAPQHVPVPQSGDGPDGFSGNMPPQ